MDNLPLCCCQSSVLSQLTPGSWKTLITNHLCFQPHQSTIMVFQAVAAYIEQVKQQEQNMEIDIKVSGRTKPIKWTFTKSNAFLTRSDKVWALFVFCLFVEHLKCNAFSFAIANTNICFMYLVCCVTECSIKEFHVFICHVLCSIQYDIIWYLLTCRWTWTKTWLCMPLGLGRQLCR